MINLRSSLVLAAAAGLTILFSNQPGYAGTETAVYSSRHEMQTAPSDYDRFEISLGYNYLHLDDADPESEHLHGADVSAFVNLNSWLALGADFMADFGSRTIGFVPGAGFDVDIDSQRYIYVFGPRLTVFRSEQFRVFVEALAGGVHAHLEASNNFGSADASAGGFAGAAGFGVDWRLSPHLSWRVIQADYVPNELDGDWQHNIRASTGVVWSFGSR